MSKVQPDTSRDEEMARRLYEEENGQAFDAVNLDERTPVVVVALDSRSHNQPVVTAIPFDSNIVVTVPTSALPQSDVTARMILTFQYARVVRLVSLFDFFICMFWAFAIPPLFLFAPLAICGYIGARKYNRCWLGFYILFVVLALFFRILLFIYSERIGSVLINGVGVMLEVYILHIVLRFNKLVAMLSEGETERLRQNRLPQNYGGRVWW